MKPKVHSTLSTFKLQRVSNTTSLNQKSTFKTKVLSNTNQIKLVLDQNYTQCNRHLNVLSECIM